MIGKVALVGAGPGDYGLFTLRGKELLQEADAVVYDRLANPRLLEFCKDGVELHYVGKMPDRHTLTQDEINALLVKLGKEGKKVVRLKGGDPFVFGRGGEEAEELIQHGIPWEVVPGVTSAISGPAYAGIPVTHRELASSFAVITGHEEPGKEASAINWASLATGPDTLIFLMGVGNLGLIVAKLVEHGKPLDTPVALIQWATRPNQRAVSGTLKDIVEVVEREGITSPAIILVGKVVSLRDTLKWFENRPLFGNKILVTRARSQASDLTELITKAGGEAIEFPTIEVSPVSDWKEIDQAINKLDLYTWLIFTSANAVEYFFERLYTKGYDVRHLAGLKVGVVGRATRDSLLSKGIIADVMPELYTGEALAKELAKKLSNSDRILFPRSEIADKLTVKFLAETGAIIDDYTIYTTTPVAEGVDEVDTLLKNDKIDCITFTSSSTVENFHTALGSVWNSLDEKPLVACIGPKTAARATELGYAIDYMPNEATIAALVEGLKEKLGGE